jgi:hypothetical protein
MTFCVCVCVCVCMCVGVYVCVSKYKDTQSYWIKDQNLIQHDTILTDYICNNPISE